MQTEKNDIFKIVITLVIALLFLIPIAYFVMRAQKSDHQNPSQINFPVKEISDKADLPVSEFDKKGRLVAYQDITFDDADWMAKCEGSDWQMGEEKNFVYINTKYDYSLTVPYTEFYNDDLIDNPFTGDKNSDSFIYAPQAFYNPQDSKAFFPCGVHGPGPFFNLAVTEKETVEEIKAEVAKTNIPGFENDYQETKINGFDALTYRTSGYSEYLNVILFGENYNYHFSGDLPDQDIVDLIAGTFKVNEKEQVMLDPALNVNNYKMSGDADLEIDFCEETKFVKNLNASMVLERQEAGELNLKIVPNQNWTKAEITKEMSENVCGISYQFIGFIGANPEYLLFASPCPAAGDENADFTSCPNRVEEIEKILE
jgi:hypothetical protein